MSVCGCLSKRTPKEELPPARRDDSLSGFGAVNKYDENWHLASFECFGYKSEIRQNYSFEFRNTPFFDAYYQLGKELGFTGYYTAEIRRNRQLLQPVNLHAVNCSASEIFRRLFQGQPLLKYVYIAGVNELKIFSDKIDTFLKAKPVLPEIEHRYSFKIRNAPFFDTYDHLKNEMCFWGGYSDVIRNDQLLKRVNLFVDNCTPSEIFIKLFEQEPLLKYKYDSEMNSLVIMTDSVDTFLKADSNHSRR